MPYGVQMQTSRRQGVSRLVCYTHDQIPHVWEQVKDHIQRALDRGSNYTLQEVRVGLCRSKLQLWCWRSDKIEAALVTAIQEEDGVKFCLLLAVGGSKLDEWKPYLSLVEDWAREKGCTELRIYGRHSWSRVLGFDVIHTKMKRNLWEAAVQKT